MAENLIKPENLVYKKTSVMTDKVMHYCPGCGHGTAHRILAEVIDEMGIQNETIGVAPVGCSVLAYNYFDVDMTEAPTGVHPLWPRASGAFFPRSMCLLIRATVTLLPSEPRRPSTPATAARISSSYSSTMVFMG